ncbi:zinc finger protein 133-like isoform X2 [Physella acuta]|nr:zinc finger protein 133-like isoform X2 [Physella acuta]XP_059148888.1 zinc finger protein 133-like isoform X2 [Physella acuta]XP_059148889.1 zinc finger protein 133-like isoform X2 [Physella acuta]
MAAVIEDLEEADLTPAEIAMVTANERAGLISQLACHFCGMQFDVKKTRSLRAHIEEVHVLGDSGYMCGVCCEEFTSRKAVETHMSTFHRAPKPLGCGTCGETFRVRNQLLKHIDSHTQDEINNNKVGLCYCGECFEFFESVTSLQIHTMTHREQAVFVCGACGLQTHHRHVMVKHLESHVISNLLAASKATEPVIEKQPPVQIDASCIQENVEIPKTTPEDLAQVKGEAGGEEEETSYKCGACQAAFANLTEALGHAESHQDEVEETPLVLSGGMEFGVLLHDSTLQQAPVITQNIEQTRLLSPETLDE